MKCYKRLLRFQNCFANFSRLSTVFYSALLATSVRHPSRTRSSNTLLPSTFPFLSSLASPNAVDPILLTHEPLGRLVPLGVPFLALLPRLIPATVNLFTADATSLLATCTWMIRRRRPSIPRVSYTVAMS
jgi:hypothetical protein